MTGDVRKLLGGYATGTLTEDERRALFAAALEDQELFNALAEEESLRRYLGDAEFREELSDALAPRETALHLVAAAAAAPAPLMAAPGPVRKPRTALWSSAGALAVAALVLVTVWVRTRPARDAHPVPETIAIERGPGPRIFEQPKAVASKPKEIAKLDPPPALYARRRSALPAILQKAPPLPPPRPSEPLKVAVLSFASDPKPEVGQSVSQALTEQLQSNKAYSVIDPNRVRAAGGSAPLTPEDAAKVGRELGADAVVIGQVGNSLLPQQPAPSSVTAAIVDSRTARTMRKATAVARPQDAKATAAALNAAFTTPPHGLVTDVNGAILTIDLGSKAGTRVDDRIQILRGSQVLGELTVTTAAETFSVGRFTGAGKPQTGDQAVPVAR
jgi:TolB-like protein